MLSFISSKVSSQRFPFSRKFQNKTCVRFMMTRKTLIKSTTMLGCKPKTINYVPRRGATYQGLKEFETQKNVRVGKIRYRRSDPTSNHYCFYHPKEEEIDILTHSRMSHGDQTKENGPICAGDLMGRPAYTKEKSFVQRSVLKANISASRIKSLNWHEVRDLDMQKLEQAYEVNQIQRKDPKEFKTYHKIVNTDIHHNKKMSYSQKNEVMEFVVESLIEHKKKGKK